MPTKKRTEKVKDLPAKDAGSVKAGSLSNSLSNAVKSIGESLATTARTL